jgi:aldehyde dehydrogenase (NAD+)
VFNLILAPGVDVAKAFVEHPQVRTFVHRLHPPDAIASRHTLEKSCPRDGRQECHHVLDDANVGSSRATLWARFGTSGQRCTAASRLIVKRIASKVKSHWWSD